MPVSAIVKVFGAAKAKEKTKKESDAEKIMRETEGRDFKRLLATGPGRGRTTPGGGGLGRRRY
jgi:hypothetical protein